MYLSCIYSYIITKYIEILFHLAPPTHSNPRSQVDFYKAVCSRVGIIPISSYEKNIDKEECILNYRKINGVESKALSLPLQVSKQLILEMQREDNSN